MTDQNEMKKELSLKERKTRLEKIEIKIAQLEHLRKQLQARENVKERKARVRRLIQYGLIAVQYLNLSDKIEPAEFEQVIRQKLGIQKQQQTESNV